MLTFEFEPIKINDQNNFYENFYENKYILKIVFFPRFLCVS
jgi:hypothetical protein